MAVDYEFLIPLEFSQNSMVGQQRPQISELQFDEFPNPQSFLVWKIRFKNQVTTCSDFPSEPMFWIKEVEMVESVDGLRSSSSTRFQYDTVLDYAELFCFTLRDDDVQEFDTIWDQHFITSEQVSL